MNAVLEVTRSWPSVSLAELVDVADLQARDDSKYVVAGAEAARLLDGLDARVLTIGQRRSFRYRSTYFDTPGGDSFRGAAHGRRRRFKIRIRRYLDSGDRWLEVKTRGLRGLTLKHRSELPAGEDVLGSEARSYVVSTLDSAGITGIEVDALVPVLQTAYLRTTLLISGRSRATIDTGLEWNRPDGDRVRAGDAVVLETKNAPQLTSDELDDRLRRDGIRPVRLSKFGVGMAVLDGTLPANRWHRVLVGRTSEGIPAMAASAPR